jgi:hypothetical protein
MALVPTSSVGHSANSAASACGLARVDFVRVLVGDGTLRYEAVGEGHRLPAERPLTPAVAQRLIGAIPFVVRRLPATGKHR